jgi:acetylglutamate kinase
MTSGPMVIKVSGDYVDQPDRIEQLARAIADLSHHQPCIMVHGGGRVIDEWLTRLGIRSVYHDGLRVTDEATLAVVEMVLSGLVNKRLTSALIDYKVDALGMSGIDRELIHAEQISPDLGYAGRVVAIRAGILAELCAQGIVPVISPISAGGGCHFNVNADHAAGAIASAVQAVQAVFLTNVPGVLVDGSRVPRLTADETQHLIEQGVIEGGMIPKVNAALEALNAGAAQVMIADLDGLLAGEGTIFVSVNKPKVMEKQ